MKRKGLNKIYYKLWKHFGKKIGQTSPPTLPSVSLENTNLKDDVSLERQSSDATASLSRQILDATASLEKRILQEMDFFRRYLIIKDICPEIINAITPRISFPTNEKEVERFLEFFRYRNPEKAPSNYDFLWHWLPDVAIDINNTPTIYQSAQFSPVEYKRNIDRYSGDDIPASIKNNEGYLCRVLFLEDPFGDGEEFCSNIIRSRNFERYSPRGYMRLCNFFLYKKQFENAQRTLEMYVKKMGYNGLDGWLAVADFAYQNGMKQFSLQSFVFNEIINTTKEDHFSRKLQGKSVALIGNGPQEKGQNKKEIIDAYDVVIRMNAYDLKPDYVKDYGEKCDIWYQYLGLTDQEWEKEKGHPDFYFMGNSPYTAEYPRHIIKRYADELNKGIKIQTTKLADISQIYKRTKIYSISGGMLMAYLVKKANPKFSADDCFGFSFKENKEELPWLHVDGGGVVMPYHRLEMERPVIRDILSRERL